MSLLGKLGATTTATMHPLVTGKQIQAPKSVLNWDAEMVIHSKGALFW